MEAETRNALEEHASLFACPACSADLTVGEDALACAGCGAQFPVEDGIPRCFVPNDWDASRPDVTDEIKAFYEETPFPSYDEFDSAASLIRKARAGRFARLLDDQVPTGARILECGCGTGQLSNFLSIANRTVFGADLCGNSLKLAQEFKRQNRLARAHFFQMNLFRPPFREGAFDLVISNGVLHHTADPRLGFETIAKRVRPGGYVLIGLYHSWGRLVTDTRRGVFRMFRDRLTWLDPNLRGGGMQASKRRAWFMDQYKNPHESKHTIGEVMGWLDAIGYRFVSSVPHSKPFRGFSDEDRLFRPEPPGNAFERALAQLPMILTGSREGGFFIVIGQRPS